MNEPAPLTPEAVDALLSAELDGEFAEAAGDLGLEPSVARDRLDAAPGVDARRRALTSARDLLASRPRVETSDEDRLVTAALAADDLASVRDRRLRRQRQWRVLVATGSVAAAIAVIVGIASLGTNSSSNSKASSAATTTENQRTADAEASGGRADAPTSPTPATVIFGDITDPSALRSQARRALSAAGSTTKSSDNSVAPAQTAGPQVPRTYGEIATGADKLFAKSASPACTPARLRSYDIPTEPALVASGTVKGERVVILIYAGNGSPYAYVIRVGDCSLVRKQPLG